MPQCEIPNRLGGGATFGGIAITAVFLVVLTPSHAVRRLSGCLRFIQREVIA
jgi:hypothetical protein